MPDQLVGRSLTVRDGVLARAAPAAVRAAASILSRCLGAAAVLGLSFVALAGIAVILWLAIELASWWIEFARQPIPGPGAGLERLLR